jgi:ribosomal protection tetracycline resistance protein
VAADFRHLAPVVVAAALDPAGTQVCQPVDRIELDLPEAGRGPVLNLLGRLGAVLLDVTAAGGYLRLAGHLPSAQVPGLAAALPDLTGGEGVLVTRTDHYQPISTDPPLRRRRGPYPTDRQAWFRAFPR